MDNPANLSPYTSPLGPQTQVNETDQQQLALGSWLTGAGGSDSTINHLKIPWNLGFCQ